MTTYKDKAEQYVREQIPELNGKHMFNHSSRCVSCATPRYIIDRKVSNRIVNERTGGSSQEVEETRFDTTDEPCLKSKVNIQLQHWLRVLEATGDWDCRVKIEDGVLKLFSSEPIIMFDLTTGAPATEADAEAYIKLVS